MPPKLEKVIRLDSIPLTQTYYTEEGYLIDRPILTSTGIFEYHNYDGTVRRELRIPDEVFDKDSLASYKGQPIIITHDAGLIDKTNVRKNSVGTILSEGYKTGDDVRAEIVIHDTDELQRSGLKELSLGYNLELDETPGVWNGEPYDAIQRNIRINHLALVREARAGDQARLNIDGRDNENKILKGGKVMAKKGNRRYDGTLSPDELKEAIEQYKAKKQGGSEEKEDPKAALAKIGNDDDNEAPDMLEENGNPEDVLNFVKNRRDRRDEAGDPGDEDEAMGMIAQMDEDIGFLMDALDELLAQRDMTEETEEDEAEVDILPKTPAKMPVRRKMPELELDDDDEEEEEEFLDFGEDDDKEEPEPVDELENLRKQLDSKDEDVKVLFDIIDTLLAKEDMSNTDGDDGIEDEDESLAEVNEDGEDEFEDEDEEIFEENEDGDDEFEDEDEFEDDEDIEDEEFEEDEDDIEDEEFEDEDEDINTDEDDTKIPHSGKLAPTMNADSVDAIVRERVRIGMIGKQLNMDGLENMNARAAKKRIIKAVRPSVNLDGKSDAYINAAFDYACNDIDAMTHKGTSYQKRQMFNSKKKESRADSRSTSADAARERMLKRMAKHSY